MSIRRMSFYLSLAFLTVLVIGVPIKSQHVETQQTDTGLISGRNVNMVSGTTLPGGDPWLQRQNEPSIAVSTRNPLHLLAGANDYRTVDMPTSEGELPGKAQGAMAGDAWVGIYKSFDGGESWTTALIHGFPQDNSAVGMASPLKAFSTASDPIVRAGTNGLFYYSGMAFNRAQEKGGGSIFLTRFIDNNNVEGGDPIKYLDTKIIDQGTSGQFIDMPRISVDIPRGYDTVTIDGQTIPRSNVYAAYTVFIGNTDVNIRSRIMFRRSTDCGATWGSAIKIGESQHIIQGATIAIDPNSGEVYVAFRRFLHPSQTNAIVIMKSTDFGQTFSKPTVIANINPFDQPATDAGGDGVSDPAGTSFRTNSYPTMTVDKDGIVYVAWTERGRGPVGEARIVMATSLGGTGWNPPTVIVDPSDRSFLGHQFMPSLSYAQGKLVLVWYDQRYDEYKGGVGNWISDNMDIRHTTDVRVAQANPGLSPSFQESVQVSKYLWALTPGSSSLLEQQQYNPPNFEMFKGGTTPFHGDYVEVTPAPQFVLGAAGWQFNTEPSNSPVFHAVWTDNRDVRPPADGHWENYTPPASDQGVFGSKTCGSVTLEAVGMRNQNIYTSALVQGIAAASPGNTKTLGNLGTYYDSGDGLIPRAFVIYVKNPSHEIKTFRLSIALGAPNVDASFVEFEDLNQLDVMIAPYSTIARTVFVRSTDTYASVKVDVVEIDHLGGAPVPNGLTASVVLNPDPTSPGYSEPNEYHDPTIPTPNIVNWDELNPNIVNPNIRDPNIRNWDEINPNIVNPNIRNLNIVSPNIRNPNIRNPNIVNPNIRNTNLEEYDENDFNGAEIADAMFTIKNDGNTTSTYTLKTYSKESLPDGVYAQLLVYRVHYTPAGDYYQETTSACELKEERHHELLLNVTNPNIRNPNIRNPNIRNPNIRNGGLENATFCVPPGEEAEAILRVIDFAPNTTLGQFRVMQSGAAFSAEEFAKSIGFAATAHAYNTDDARTTPKEELSYPTSATKLVISTSSLPDGVVGNFYSATLTADGGTTPYAWTLNSGELPPGLGLGGGGLISGTPTLTAAGLYHFIVRVDDSSLEGDFDTQEFSIYIDSDGSPDALTITTTLLPSGVLYHWYGAALEATGGVWPRTWSLAGGSLPTGLSLDPDGVISGTIELEVGQDYPTTYNFSVIVTDNAGASTSPRALSIYVNLATGNYVTISGTVYDSGGNPLDGVVMRGLPNTPISGANGTPGYYEDEVPELWSGTVTPFKTGQAFTPASRAYSMVGSDQSSQDYGGGAIPSLSEINIKHTTPGFPETDIPDGGSFNFGLLGAGELYALFTIENLGAGELTITSITITGTDSDQFFVDEQPSSPVASGGTTTFVLYFGPTSEGILSASIAIANNDADENPYDITLTGTGTYVPPVAAWAKTYGGPNFDFASSIQQISDGGYIVAGYNNGKLWVLKLDSTGDVIWQKTYGGSGADSIQQTSDGGYIVAGEANFGGSRDAWVLKLDDAGDVVWQKTYGGLGTDNAQSIRQTSDGGYIVKGSTGSFGAGSVDIWVLKLNNAGDVVWQKTYGGPNAEDVQWGAQSIQQTSDGGYIVAGETSSFGAGNNDIWVLKLDSTGDVIWQKTYGGPNSDSPNSVKQTSDGGYIVAGETSSFGAGNGDVWLLKLNGAGDVVWQKTYGGPNGDYAYSFQQTSDAGYIVAGTTYSLGAGDGDFWVLKLDDAGDVVWQKTYGGTGQDVERSIQQTSDAGYIVAGATYSFGAGDADFWVLKLRPDGSIDPSCSPEIGAESTAIPAFTSVTPSTSTATAEDSAATVAVTTVAPADTSAVVQTQCEKSGYETYEFDSKWGEYGSGNGQFIMPQGVTKDVDGYVYVADSGNNRIQKFTADGAYVTQWGVQGSGEGELYTPFGIAVDSGMVYVAERSNGRISRFTTNGEFVDTFGSAELYLPQGIAIDDGYLYVADHGSHKVVKFTTYGTFVIEWGTQGSGQGEFEHAFDVAVDSSGHVYVSDEDNDRVQKFTSNGVYVTQWQTNVHSWMHPQGVAVDDSDYVYVVTHYHVQKFLANGTFKIVWGSAGSEDGELDSARALFIDGLGYVYVADTQNNRIQKFRKKYE